MFDPENAPLKYLMGSYFHQDFSDENGSPKQVVAAYLRENQDLATPLATEVARVLSDANDDSVLERLSEEYGSCYAADWDGGTYREWFASIEAQARAFAAEHREADG